MKSLAQMHAIFRQKLKQKSKEQNEKRRLEAAEREKLEMATMHLHHITRKMPPQRETVIQKSQKPRNYLQMRQATNSQEQALLK